MFETMSLFQATLRFKDIKQFRFVCVNSKFEAFESRSCAKPMHLISDSASNFVQF